MNSSAFRPERRLRSAEDFIVALRALSAADLARLQRIADLLSARISSWSGADLLQTATYRTLQGDRHWPADLAIVVYLGRTMESIAYRERAKARAGEAGWADAAAEATPELSVQASMEQDEAERLLRMRVADAFARHPNARRVALAMLDGHEGAALREITGLDQTAYDTARRAVRREVLRRLRGGP